MTGKKIVFYSFLFLLTLVGIRFGLREYQIATTSTYYVTSSSPASSEVPIDQAEKVVTSVAEIRDEAVTKKLDKFQEKLSKGEDQFRKFIDKISKRKTLK